MGYFNDGMGQINKLSVNGEVSQPSPPSVCDFTAEHCELNAMRSGER